MGIDFTEHEGEMKYVNNNQSANSRGGDVFASHLSRNVFICISEENSFMKMLHESALCMRNSGDRTNHPIYVGNN